KDGGTNLRTNETSVEHNSSNSVEGSSVNISKFSPSKKLDQDEEEATQSTKVSNIPREWRSEASHLNDFIIGHPNT
ncbi:hypothetical protein HAX54_001764, partial [Datura stramonium]|nr:hypothetical protein [Datura stramonium]